MLALAIADSAVCVGKVILSTDSTIVFVTDAVLYVLNVAGTFSVFLLVFVAIERLIAILRPHSFNTNPRRAWKALLITVAASVGLVTLFKMPRETPRLQPMRRGFKVCIPTVCFLTITICYIMIAAMLLVRAKSARTRDSTFNPTASPKLRRKPVHLRLRQRHVPEGREPVLQADSRQAVDVLPLTVSGIITANRSALDHTGKTCLATAMTFVHQRKQVVTTVSGCYNE